MEHLTRFEGLKEAMYCHFKFLKHVSNWEKRAMHDLLLKELHEELDDVPVFDSYITTTLLKKTDDLSYFNDDELQQYQNAGTEAKASFSWSSLHHKDFGDSGDSLHSLWTSYMEFLNQSCKGMSMQLYVLCLMELFFLFYVLAVAEHTCSRKRPCKIICRFGLQKEIHNLTKLRRTESEWSEMQPVKL